MTSRLNNGFDAQGNPSLSWDVMGKLGSRVVSALLLLVALIWISVGHSFPVDFWKLLHENEPSGPDWMGLAITGAGSVFFSLMAILPLVVAFRLVFRSQPERLTLKHGKLVYEAGSSALMPAAGTSLWRGLLGIARYEVAVEDFGGASVATKKGIQHVALQFGARQIWIGRWLPLSDQQQLVETLTEWKSRPG
jgi:hypothetical protein